MKAGTRRGVLQRSNWRMLGNLTADPKVLRRWLKAGKIVVRGDLRRLVSALHGGVESRYPAGSRCRLSRS